MYAISNMNFIFLKIGTNFQNIENRYYLVWPHDIRGLLISVFIS